MILLSTKKNTRQLNMRCFGILFYQSNPWDLQPLVIALFDAQAPEFFSRIQQSGQHSRELLPFQPLLVQYSKIKKK